MAVLGSGAFWVFGFCRKLLRSDFRFRAVGARNQRDCCALSESFPPNPNAPTLATQIETKATCLLDRFVGFVFSSVVFIGPVDDCRLVSKLFRCRQFSQRLCRTAVPDLRTSLVPCNLLGLAFN